MAKRTFQPNAPSRNLWLAAAIIGGVGILARFLPLGELTVFNYWLLLIAFFLLLMGTAYRKM